MHSYPFKQLADEDVKQDQISPSTDEPWGRLLATGLQVDSELLITTIQVLPVRQFSVHPTVQNAEVWSEYLTYFCFAEVIIRATCICRLHQFSMFSALFLVYIWGILSFSFLSGISIVIDPLATW